MGFIKNLLSRLYLDKEHKAALEHLALILKESKNLSSAYECRAMRGKIIEFLAPLKDDKYRNIRTVCADVMDYLADTCYHAEHLYHKPKHNGWHTKREFPDINDYVNIGTKI